MPDRLEPRLPTGSGISSTWAIARRFALAGGLVVLLWLLVLVERDGYTDTRDGSVSVVDALYYTTVTLTTTGYGDITPVTVTARLTNALVVTPLRVLFVIVLVGTTIQALTERSRTELRLTRWRRRMSDHVVVLGYGTKGRNAVRSMVLRDCPKERIVVVECDPQTSAEAEADGLVVVTGSATRPEVLRAALIERAGTVIVALDRDDTAILATLTIRRMLPGIRIVAAAREAQNAELLAQSGAQSVVVSSETTGRLLGLAIDSPASVKVIEDLVAFGQGLDLRERPAAPEEVGVAIAELHTPVLGVVRDGRLHRFGDEDLGQVRPGDRLLVVSAEA